MAAPLERDELTVYMKKHNIEGLVQHLTEGLLRDQPECTPQEHWAHMLRVEKLKSQKSLEKVDLFDQITASQVPGSRLRDLFDAIKQITHEIVPQATIRTILDSTLELLNCDRVSLFTYDERLQMLKLNASNLDVPIRVKPGQGIAGSVFETKETINIADCYRDHRFDRTFDKMTGYRTNNSLTMPLLDHEGACMGVIQAINKLPDPDYKSEASTNAASGERKTVFSRIDEILLENLSQHVVVALRNAELYKAALATSESSHALLSMHKSLSQDLGAQSTILAIEMHANRLVQADRCNVFLVDEYNDRLCCRAPDTGKPVFMSKDQGIAGACVSEGKLIVIDDCYQDERFNRNDDKREGYKTVSMLCVPVMRRTPRPNCGNVLAVIQMINKTDFDDEIGTFNEEDIQVLTTCEYFIGTNLEGSSLLEKMSRKKDVEPNEGSLAFNSMSRNSSLKHQHAATAAISEEGGSIPQKQLIERRSIKTRRSMTTDLNDIREPVSAAQLPSRPRRRSISEGVRPSVDCGSIREMSGAEREEDDPFNATAQHKRTYSE